MRELKRGRRVRAAALGMALLLFLGGCGGAQQEVPAPKPQAESDQGKAAPPAPKQGFQPQPGYQAANFTATDVFTGEKFTLNDLRGQVVFLNFWATWCPPCKGEMPEMELLHKEMGDRVRIVALGADPRETPSQLASFATSMNLTFTIAYDRAIAMEAYQVRGIPTSFFIDKDGVIRARHVGPLTVKQMKEYIAEAEKER